MKVWQLAIELTEDIYRLCAKFPKHEVYGLTSQLQRAAVSVPSNIAEGHARNSRKEFQHSISIAFGSLAELETQLLLAQRFNYIALEEANKAFSKADEL